jgi:catechol 2,3-dioxygenase-like lactoylglutathione lyase family enzyme
MPKLDHTIVPAHDKDASARFLACILGLPYDGATGHFAPVRLSDGITLDFADQDAFEVTEQEFHQIFGRIQAEGLSYGSMPWSAEDGKTNAMYGGPGVYFRDPNGHLLEILTRRQDPEVG